MQFSNSDVILGLPKLEITGNNLSIHKISQKCKFEISPPFSLKKRGISARPILDILLSNFF
jgi:hypothetical protein